MYSFICSFFCLFIYLLIYLFTYLFIYLFIYFYFSIFFLSIYSSIYFHLFIHPAIYLFIYLFTYLFVCLFIYIYIYLFIYLYIIILRWMGKNKAQAHHTSTYFHTRVVCRFNSIAFAIQRYHSWRVLRTIPRVHMYWFSTTLRLLYSTKTSRSSVGLCERTPSKSLFG